MLDSAAPLMWQSQLITNSPRAFVFLQLHLQKHRAVETSRQFPATSRSTPASRGLRLRGDAEGLLPAQGAGAAQAGSALPAPVPLAGEPQASSGGRRGAGLFIFLLIYVVQKGEVCLHLCNATSQGTLMSSWLPKNRLEGEHPYYQQKQMAAFPAGSTPYAFQRISGLFLHNFW